MKDPDYQDVYKAIVKSVTDATRLRPNEVEAALMGVLTTFMLEHIKLHQRVCYLESLQKNA